MQGLDFHKLPLLPKEGENVAAANQMHGISLRDNANN